MSSYLICEGGLGNQLFIWNAAHYLHAEGLRITVITSRKSFRKLELIEIKRHCTHDIEIRQTNLPFIFFRILDAITSKFLIPRKIIRILGIVSYPNPFDHIQVSKRKWQVHRGYFQNREMVDTQSSNTMPELIRLVNENFISIRERLNLPPNYEAFHIRRGDLNQNQETIGVLSDEYYRSLRGNLPLVVTTEKLEDMSDKFDAVAVSTEQNSSNWQSFAILSHANRLVTANSTFSWWAAMAAKYMNPNCVVIQPDRYYKYQSDPNFLKVDDFLEVKALFR